MKKRDVLMEVRKNAVGGNVRIKMAVYPSEASSLREKGFNVITSKRGIYVHSEKHKTECRISWDGACVGTEAHTYWMLVQKHRRENAKQSRDNLRAVDKRFVYDVLLDLIDEPDEEDSFFSDEE